MPSASLETKLAAARTRLILDKPFLGALVLRLPLTAADPDWCPTTATDARAFYYNPDYIRSLSLEQTQFVLAHEALHCALSHFARRRHRVKHRWDLACDFAINPLLVEDGLPPPDRAVVLDLYKGMTAEEIYPLLEDNDQTETLDRHVYDSEGEGGEDQGGEGDAPRPPPQGGEGAGEGGGAGAQGPREGAGGQAPGGTPADGEAPGAGGGARAAAPPPLTPDERETLAIQWQQRMAGAAQQAMQAGRLGGTLARLIDHLLQPRLPWRMLLARYLTALARDDYSYTRPSRREGAFILPSLRSQQIDLVVALDTSGSIQPAEIQEFVSEIDAIKGQMRARITLLPCDAELAPGAPWVFEPWEAFHFPDRVRGGGGTRFTPVFDWLEGRDRAPEALVWFTDAQGEFPHREPNYPVFWLVKGRSPVPWGQRIQLN